MLENVERREQALNNLWGWVFVTQISSAIFTESSSANVASSCFPSEKKLKCNHLQYSPFMFGIMFVLLFSFSAKPTKASRSNLTEIFRYTPSYRLWLAASFGRNIHYNLLNLRQSLQASGSNLFRMQSRRTFAWVVKTSSLYHPFASAPNINNKFLNNSFVEPYFQSADVMKNYDSAMTKTSWGDNVDRHRRGNKTGGRLGTERSKN